MSLEITAMIIYGRGTVLQATPQVHSQALRVRDVMVIAELWLLEAGSCAAGECLFEVYDINPIWPWLTIANHDNQTEFVIIYDHY